MSAVADGRSLGALLGAAARDGRELLATELALTRRHAKRALARVVAAIAMLAVALVLGLAALGALVAGAILGLDDVLPTWASALVVGGALVLAAGIVAAVGLAALRSAGMARVKDSARQVGEDVGWIVRRVKTNGS
ncbi:MAG: phage holin family protein [Thermoleophilia bacterium]